MSEEEYKSFYAGSPAQAGIDRSGSPPFPNRARFPRTGGDRPLSTGRRVLASMVPPHRRG